MTHSGATQLVEAARTRLRARMRGPTASWKQAAETVWGPLLTLAALILIDQVARKGMPVLYAFPHPPSPASGCSCRPKPPPEP